MKKLCKCGCGKEVKPGNKYINSHNLYNRKCSDETKIKISKIHKNKIVSKETRKKISESKKEKIPWNKGITPSKKTRMKISKSNKGRDAWNKGKFMSKDFRMKLSRIRKNTIKKIIEKYYFFSKIEELRYNPLNKKEIQVHCKNHNCENSKEKNGWFTPTYSRLYERIRQLEKENGNGGAYFYCSQKCRDTCPLYNVQSDPYKNNIIPYTYQENQLWRQIVLKEDKNLCQYCGDKATDVHHIKPVKTHPHLALDPDNGISFCEKCHYKIGHKTETECSTSSLANKTCKEI